MPKYNSKPLISRCTHPISMSKEFAMTQTSEKTIQLFGSDNSPISYNGLAGFRKEAISNRDYLASEKMVRVIHGIHDLTLPVAGKSIGEVRYYLVTSLNLHLDASAFLNRRNVRDGTLIPLGSALEFLHMLGQKGVGKVWKNLDEIREAFGLDEVRLKQWREKGLPVHEFGDGSILLTETDFDAWSAATLGLITLPSLPDRQVEDVNLDAPYLTIKRAAKVTILSESHLRRAVRSGDLPASNVGSLAHPIWRIKREDIEGWMKRKSGGAQKIPPNSKLSDLVKHHLPRL